MKLYEIKRTKAAYNIILYCNIPLILLYFIFKPFDWVEFSITIIPALLLLIFKIIDIVNKNKHAKALIKHQKKLHQFKKSAHQISINLSEVKIKTKKTQEKILVQPNTNYGEDHYEMIDVIKNKVSIKLEINENSILLQFSVECNHDDLAIAFALKKTTTFYYDLNNFKENYYLDLEFLKELHSETSPARLYRPVYLTHQSLEYFSWTYFNEFLPSISNHRLN